MITQTYLDELTYEIIGSAIEVHKLWEEVCWKMYITNA